MPTAPIIINLQLLFCVILKLKNKNINPLIKETEEKSDKENFHSLRSRKTEAVSNECIFFFFFFFFMNGNTERALSRVCIP